MASIKGNALEEHVHFHTNVLNISGMVMQLPHVEQNQTLQVPLAEQICKLHKQIFRPVTPLKANVLEWLLQGHPNNRLVNYVLHGLCEGFSLQYKGHQVGHQPHNLPSAFESLRLLRERLIKEVNLKCMLGLFDQIPWPNLICSLVGMVPKKIHQRCE